MVRDGPAGPVAGGVSGGARRASRTRRPSRARYLPIAEHGLIGDLHTVALVGTDGTIDWYCCPRVWTTTHTLDQNRVRRRCVGEGLPGESSMIRSSRM
jgi:hypothetical protein